MSVNKVILLGHLGRDPEMRYAPSGAAIINVSLATSESWKDKQTGEKKEKTEWHNLVFFDKLAEIAGEYLRKGSQVYVEGKLQTRKWQDKDGKDKYTTDIRVEEMRMLGGKEERRSPAQADTNSQYKRQEARGAYQKKDTEELLRSDFDSDIPFN